MMEKKITAISVQKKNPNRVSIYLDGTYSFGVAKIVAAWLTVGQVLTEEKIQQLKQQDTEESAYQKALTYLSYRPQTEKEIQIKLEKAGFDASLIQKVLSLLLGKGYVQDEQFAKSWIENRNTFRPRGRKALFVELRQKGVSEEIIRKVLDEEVDEESNAYAAGVTYAKRLREKPWMEFRNRLGAYLGRRGFSFQTANSVVKKVWDEIHDPVGF